MEAVKETPVYIHTNEEGFKRLRKQHRLGLWLNDKKLYNWSKNHKDIMKILEHIKRRAERDIDFMIKNIIFFGGKPSVDKHLVEAYRTVYDTLIFIQQEEFGIDPLNNNPESKFMETMIKKLNDKIIEKFNLK